MTKRELLSPAHDTASSAIVSVQAATTRVKEIITECVSKGIPDSELTKRLNAAIAQECKYIANEGFREQFKKSLVIAARKWHYELSQTYRINEHNLRQAAMQQPLNVGLLNLLDKTPYQKQFEFRKLLDDGTNPGIPVIKDYQAGVKLAMKALSAEPPKIITTRDGRAYAMPARLRAEMAVRYAAAVENLQRLINDGVLFCWISSHPNCSPRCSKYQGKLYSLFSGTVVIDGKEYRESGTIDGIPYRPINEALAGPNGDGNGCISGYNCRHRAIEYERGSKAPADYSEAEIKREYAIDKQQRDYENRIRQMKQEEKQLRACGMEKEAKDLRKKWRVLTREYQMYSIDHNRAFYPYRCVIDRSEQTEGITTNSTVLEESAAEMVDNPVNWSIINNKQYFDTLKEFVGGKRTIGKTIAHVALKALQHRDHSDREDLYLIDARTGQEVAKNVKATERLKVFPTERMKQLLGKDDGRQYIIFHNHPLSSPPSAVDFNSLYKNPKIKFGVIVGHDGTVYKYTAPKEIFPEIDLKISIIKHKKYGLSEEGAIKKAYEELSKIYGFSLEVLTYGEKK